MRVDDPCVADLQFVGVVQRAGGLFGQAQRANAVPRHRGSIKRIANADEVILGKLEVDARIQDQKSKRSGEGFADVPGKICRIERIDDGLILAIDGKCIEEIGRRFGDGAADVAGVRIQIITRLLLDERVSGVEGGVVAKAVDAALKFLRTWLGDDLDTPVSDAVVLRGKGILIDAHFQDR